MRRFAAILVVGFVAGLMGCAEAGSPATDGSIVLEPLDTLVTTASGALAYVVDLDVAQSGLLYAADMQASQVFVVNPTTGDTTRLGRPGAGPGELDGPWAIRTLEDGVLVVDRGNGRIQRLSSSGDALGTTAVTSMVMRAQPFLGRDGGLVVGSGGADSCLAVVFDSTSRELLRVGTPVVTPPRIADFGAIKEEIRQGEVPAFFRNASIVAEDGDGGIWLALAAEGEVRRYDGRGRLAWSKKIEEPEMATARAEFFRMNAEDENPARLFSLTYFQDLAVVDGSLWLLLQTATGTAAVIVVVAEDGMSTRRIEIPGAAGASSFAVDTSRGMLFLSTPADAQILAAAVPAGAF